MEIYKSSVLNIQKTSRRNFIKKGTAGIITAMAAPSIISCANSNESNKKKLGLALMGLGYYSTDILAPSIQMCKNTYLAGIITGTPSKAEEWSAKYNLKKENIYNYDNFDDIVNNDDIDIVYVVLPNGLHKEFTIRAAKAGKHVICEKPMAVNAAECREMIDACNENNVQLTIGYRMHFEPNTQEIMRLAKDKDFGDIRQISTGAGFNMSSFDSWKSKKELAGGAMMDMGVYPLQAARYSTGEEPISVSAQTFKIRPDKIEADEVTSYQLQFPSGTVANCDTGFHANFNYLKVFCEKGWYELDPFSSYNGIKGKKSKGEFNFPQVNQQARQMDEVAWCIMNDKPMRVKGEEGLKDIIVVEKIQESIALGGKTVEI
ncbi:MAG: Gfo/Idh/MocA family oxidoreductase [Cyclobacteriaceae bacterium]|nr:Gfo/Idh/MocA family oxidoreductase [Cyclobacteriaceae bacterium]MCK5370809.1 Gfo/Idh/MocA family oxidoreductase [Cyclobacteriaceae bacterium]